MALLRAIELLEFLVELLCITIVDVALVCPLTTLGGLGYSCLDAVGKLDSC